MVNVVKLRRNVMFVSGLYNDIWVCENQNNDFEQMFCFKNIGRVN